MTYYEIPKLEKLVKLRFHEKRNFLVGKTSNTYLLGVYSGFPCIQCIRLRFSSSVWVENEQYEALMDEDFATLEKYIKDYSDSLESGVILELDLTSCSQIKKHMLLPSPLCPECTSYG